MSLLIPGFTELHTRLTWTNLLFASYPEVPSILKDYLKICGIKHKSLDFALLFLMSGVKETNWNLTYQYKKFRFAIKPKHLDILKQLYNQDIQFGICIKMIEYCRIQNAMLRKITQFLLRQSNNTRSQYIFLPSTRYQEI